MSRDNRMVTKYGKPGSPEPEITNKFNLCGGSFSTRHTCKERRFIADRFSAVVNQVHNSKLLM